MTMKWMVGLTASLSLFAQDSIQGPLVGWTYEQSTATLRAIQGIPGSSLLGARAGAELSRAVAAPGGAFAVATVGESREARLLDLRKGDARKLDVPAGADGIFVSPRGASAVLLYREQGKALVLTGLPGEPAVGASFETSAASFAVSDDGNSVMALEQNGVRMLDRDANQWMLNMEAPVVSAVFVEGSHDAVLAGPAGVFLAREASGNASVEKLWEGDAVAAVLEGDAALIATREEGLLALNRKDGSVQRVECACAAVTLTRLAQSVYRVNELAEGPLWLVDLNGSTPRAVFVPADAKPEPAEQ